MSQCDILTRSHLLHECQCGTTLSWSHGGWDMTELQRMIQGPRRKLGRPVNRMVEEIGAAAASGCLMWWRWLARDVPAQKVFEAWPVDICRRPRGQTRCA